MTAKFTVLGNTTLATSSASVTFSSIPGGYKDLVLVADYGITSQGQAEMRINGGTTNHDFVNIAGTGSSTISANAINGNYIPLSYHAYSNPGHHPMAIAQFLDYSATNKHKSVLVRNGNAATGVEAVAGRVATTLAITTILVYASSQFTSGSTFRLLGVN
jgi:hypothetical protein